MGYVHRGMLVHVLITRLLYIHVIRTYCYGYQISFTGVSFDIEIVVLIKFERLRLTIYTLRMLSRKFPRMFTIYNQNV